MSRLAVLRHRLIALLRRRRAQDELTEEMHLRLALRREQLEAAGLPPHAAHAAAARRFGSLLRLQEASIDEWGWRWLEQFAQDIRFAGRLDFRLSKEGGRAVTRRPYAYPRRSRRHRNRAGVHAGFGRRAGGA